MSTKLKGLKSLETSPRSKLLHDKGKKNKENNVDSFKFLVPKIPPKTQPNVIPTGKQIPRTPLKYGDTVPKSTVNQELCADLSNEDELKFVNMIPKGREIPRTPPVYLNLPFRESGCIVKPLPQASDLGVEPICDLDDETDLNIKEIIKEKNITIRKHPLPKKENNDWKKSSQMSLDPTQKDENVFSENSSEVSSKGRKHRGTKGKNSALSTNNDVNIVTRRNPSRKAREGVNYKLSL